MEIQQKRTGRGDAELWKWRWYVGGMVDDGEVHWRGRGLREGANLRGKGTLHEDEEHLCGFR